MTEHLQRRTATARAIAFASAVAFAFAIVGTARATAQGGAASPATATATETATAPAAAPTRLLWTYAPAGSSFSEVVAGGGTVFAVDRAGRVHAIDAATGTARWTTDRAFEFSFGYGLALAPEPGFAAVLVGSDAGLHALDAVSGKPLWHTRIAAGVAGPACTKDVVVAGAADGKVYGCDLRTGAIRWEHDVVEDRPEDPPGFAGADARFAGRPARPRDATTDGTIVVLSVFDQCRTLAIEASSGKRRWAFGTKGWMFGRPAIGEHNVFVGSQDGGIYAVDKDLGKLAWRVATGARVEAGAAPAGRFVYIGSCDGRLYALDQVVGRVAWTFATEHEEGQGAPIYGCPVVLGDRVFLATMRGMVHALDRRTGALLWQLRPVPQSELEGELVTDGERLFVASRKDGDAGTSAVVAIDAR